MVETKINELPCGGTHEPYEDCMICVSCQTCREDVDENDVCPDCGGDVDSD